MLNVAKIDDLNETREQLLKSVRGEDQKEQIRSVEEAAVIYKFIGDLTDYFTKFLASHSNFSTLFYQDFGSLKDFQDEKILINKVFKDDELFDDCDEFLLSIQGESSDDLIRSHYDFFEVVKNTYVESHDETQEFIKEKTSLNTKPENLNCQCQTCLSLFRTKVLEVAGKDVENLIKELEEKIDDQIVNSTVGRISQTYSHYEKKLSTLINKMRFKLRKGSYRKFETSAISRFGEHFNAQGAQAKIYREKVKAFLFSELEDIKPDFFQEHDLDKFFDKLALRIWKGPHVLKKEFRRHVETIQQFKRKDISSTILKNYLGQFWVYSEARKKNRKVYYHMGPTNSGKTYHALEALAASEKGSYLAPLRLLASEVFDTLNEKGVATNLLTGEEIVEVPHAQHYSSTIEMARLKDEFECVVIDEIQMITDVQRGWAWTRALVHMNADEIHICGDASAKDLVEKILSLTGDELIIKEYERMTELVIEKNPVQLSDLQKGDALIVFSRRNALKRKIDLEKSGHKVSIIYGMLNPDVRREQARRFDKEETSIIVSTDAISMGMNLPVRRIVFSTFIKFYKNAEHPLSKSHIKQIAGRAGRFGRFPKGYVSWLENPDNDNGYETLIDALESDLEFSKVSMVGPDLDLYMNVNQALEEENLQKLRFSEFLRIFFTIDFEKPFCCVQLDEMIEIAEMVEQIDQNAGGTMAPQEIFGFSCAPVNLGNSDHVQYFYKLTGLFAKEQSIVNDFIDTTSNDIDYLETSIKCMELYQWLARHFQNKFFVFDLSRLNENKLDAVEKLNNLLSEKTIKYYDPHKRYGKRKFRPKASSNKSSSRRGGKTGKRQFKRKGAKNSSRSKTRR